MSPGHDITADGPSPTIFTVLGQTARSHSRRYLAVECLFALVAATVVVVWQLEWWPLASLAAAVSLYAAWGLLARRDDRAAAPWRARFRASIAVLATAATLLGVGALGVKAFTGTAPGPYGACYRPDGRTYGCHSDGSPRRVSHG